MKIKPLGDRVLVKVLDAKEKTEGGIYLPETAKEKPQEAEVIAVGPGKTLESGKFQEPQVKVKDKILFGKYSGTTVTTKEGQEYLILREEDILAVIN
ncbi:MAG: co-chaperone GroES [Candidatus Omnitrophica bacterium]|nr:co-chaperone GroES [Candidatus Omnitrophota bacterium]